MPWPSTLTQGPGLHTLLVALLLALPLTTSTKIPRSTAATDTITFNTTTQIVSQSGGTAYFAVHRTLTSSSIPLTVDFTTTGGTAIPGTEYTATSGTLSFDATDTIKSIGIHILDTTPSASEKETFHIKLSNPSSGAVLGTYPEAVVSIKNRYPAPSLVDGFDWSIWKLTVPVNQYRTADPSFPAWSIQPKDLLNGFADEFFYANGGAVVFTAPANGASTTPGAGSDHTRSELRELYTGSGANANDWDSSIGGVMTGECVVEQIANGSKEATFAQIHGQDYVFVLLDYRVTTGEVELAVYDGNAAGAAKVNTVVVGGVKVGDAIVYSLGYEGETVTATVNGVEKSVGVDQSWDGAAVYFKAGAYHSVANVGNLEGEETVVRYSRLEVSH